MEFKTQETTNKPDTLYGFQASEWIKKCLSSRTPEKVESDIKKWCIDMLRSKDAKFWGQKDTTEEEIKKHEIERIQRDKQNAQRITQMLQHRKKCVSINELMGEMYVQNEI